MINKKQLQIKGKQVDLYPCAVPGRPVIYLNTVGKEGTQVYEALLELGCEPFHLVTVGGLNWDHDMSPWAIPPIAEGDTPCTGGAGDYLRVLTEDILPEVEKQIDGRPAWRALAGYSLAGLCALYALYRTDRFQRAASVSGSLWFPGFLEYAVQNRMRSLPSRLYLSLGDREGQTQNPYLMPVRENTEQIATFYKELGIPSTFCLNPGGHYKNMARRTAVGIAWLLKE